MTGKHAGDYCTQEDAAIRDIIENEMQGYLRDIEFRVSQAYDVERRGRHTDENVPMPVGKVYAEDMDLLTHQLTGYQLLNNKTTGGATANGCIAWTSLNMVYNGVTSAITDGATTLISGSNYNKFVWWDPNVSMTTLQQGNTKPVLNTSATAGAALLFVNNAGTAYDVWASTIPGVVADQAIDAGALQAGIVTPAKLNTLQHLLF